MAQREGQGTAQEPADAAALPLPFAVMQEIAIIEHLARNRFEKVMPEGLLLPHFSVLNHLTRLGDDKSLKYLAFAFQVSKGTMTNTVQRLEAKGYVKVAPDPHDGRGKRVTITPAGRAVRNAAIAAIAPDIEELSQTVGAKTMASLLKPLAAIRAMLDEKRNVDKPAEGNAATTPSATAKPNDR